VLKLTDREPPIFSIAPPAYVAEFSENVLFVTVADAFGLFQIVPPFQAELPTNVLFVTTNPDVFE